MNKKIIKSIIGWVVYIAAIFLAIHLIITYVGQRTTVSGDSMLNTLYNNDNLIVDKISYRFSKPKRFDIIVFPHEDTHYIKRIIGLPGETVQIIEGEVYINGEKLEESYGNAPIRLENYGMAVKPLKIGENEYFVLGDNRNASLDSRFQDVGMIKRDEIIGKAWIRIYPFSRFGSL